MGAAVLGIFGNSNEEAIYRRFCAWRKSSVACNHLGCRNHPPAPQQEHDTGRNSKDRRDERPPETRHSALPEGGDLAGDSADEKEPANQNLDAAGRRGDRPAPGGRHPLRRHLAQWLGGIGILVVPSQGIVQKPLIRILIALCIG